jgi:hypothetical protein
MYLFVITRSPKGYPTAMPWKLCNWTRTKPASFNAGLKGVAIEPEHTQLAGLKASLAKGGARQKYLPNTVSLTGPQQMRSVPLQTHFYDFPNISADCFLNS